MPNKGIRNAVYKRAGGKGQSSKFYNIYGKVVKPTDPTGFKGGQGWTAPKPQIGSMLSLGIMKQNRNAGGNNVCQPGPKPKKSSTSNTLNPTNTMVPANAGLNGIGYGDNNSFGLGSLSPTSFIGAPGAIIESMVYKPDPGFSFTLAANYTASASSPPPATPTGQISAFSNVSFINCDNGTVRTYNSANLGTGFGGGSYSISGGGQLGLWIWQNDGTSPDSTAEANFWNAAIGKNIKVKFDLPNAGAGVSPATTTGFPQTFPQTIWTAGLLAEYCDSSNNDCDCRGPLAQCPCRKGGC